MKYKLKRYSKSNIPMRKPDIKFKNNKIKTEIERNNQENELTKEDNIDEDYYANNDDESQI